GEDEQYRRSVYLRSFSSLPLLKQCGGNSQRFHDHDARRAVGNPTQFERTSRFRRHVGARTTDRSQESKQNNERSAADGRSGAKSARAGHRPPASAAGHGSASVSRFSALSAPVRTTTA